MVISLEPFLKLSSAFKKHGFQLYLVGGSVRDYLLKKEFTDFDMVTDATPNQMKEFLKGWNYTFEKFGTVSYKEEKLHLEITTMRIEGKYDDSRHPSFIKFVKDIKLDYKRRDFTINSLYMDDCFHIFDFCEGQKHLKEKKLVFIGDILLRIKEDPLRILRAERFMKKLGFTMSSEDLEVLHKNEELLTLVNKNKIKEELNKFN